MTDMTQRLQYDEIREISFLERSMIDRGLGLAQLIALAAVILSVSLAFFHFYAAAFGTPETRSFRSTHLTVMLVLAVLLHPLRRKSCRDPIMLGDGGDAMRIGAFLFDILLVVIGIGIQIYTLWDVEEFMMREGELTQTDVLVGSVMLLLVLEVTRRTVGWPMVIIAAFFAVHALYAPSFPGFFYGPPTSFEKYIDLLFMRSEGIFGIPLFVASTYIVLFIMFGAVLIRSGAGRFFIDLAVALTGHRTGGPAKAAVVASAFLGTVSGSAVANVVTTGSFTIPLMRRLGYRPKFAAAVEACASSGGQITPPIMGAAAFIIAEFMQVSYLWVVVAAILPTLLYFATIYFMVDLEAAKHNIERIPKERLPRLGEVLAGGWHLMFALVVLVGLLAYGYTAMMAAFWSTLALIALSFISKTTRMSAIDLLAALENGVRAAMPVSIACACAGIIIGSIFVSGLGLKFTNSVISIADGNLFALLVMTGLAAIVLGMGMTTTAVYITVAALIVPSLIEIGVSPMAAHLFAFYFGVVSSITPPVALASFAAAAIAGAPAMATAVESARVGIAKYIVPFIFVYNPALLFEGSLWLTAYAFLSAMAGLWGLSAALEGWMRGPLNTPWRAAVGIFSVFLLVPATVDLFGLIPGHYLVVIGAIALAGIGLLRYGVLKERVA
ncbi:MAG: TRAP transporter permease [Alphaproteobacteria bacterium]|nr:TRAP transporter permease [Alphaproteobacteria bacterium]